MSAPYRYCQSCRASFPATAAQGSYSGPGLRWAPGGCPECGAARAQVIELFVAPGALYASDNGRLICHRCAGAAARYTGRDLSGQEIERYTVPMVAELCSVLERSTLACECRRTTLAPEPGDDQWPREVVDG